VTDQREEDDWPGRRGSDGGKFNGENQERDVMEERGGGRKRRKGKRTRSPELARHFHVQLPSEISEDRSSFIRCHCYYQFFNLAREQRKCGAKNGIDVPPIFS